MPSPFPIGEVAQPQQTGQQVQRRRQPPRGGQIVAAALGRNKMQYSLPRELVGNAHAAAKIGQIRAAAHAHVLAVVDQFAALRIVK